MQEQQLTAEECEKQFAKLVKRNMADALKQEQQNYINKLSKKEQYNLFLSKLSKILTQIEIVNDTEKLTPIFRAAQAKLMEF